MPSAPSTADFLAALDAAGLLTSAQTADLRAWAKAQNADPNAVATELNKRGWLTGYQIKEVYRGRAKGLFVGPYRILDLLGEGGMGRVFKATHTRMGRDVALKVIRREKLANPATIQRFRKEIRAVAQLAHPNVVLAFDADEAGGDHFLAMEFVDGTDLTKLVRERGPLPIPEACEYVRQAALGLHHASERGLVHRDVKPSNIIAAKSGQVKVLDLGLAMLQDRDGSDSATRVTQDGFVIGTPDFLAPEQARTPQDVDTRADVYALGATLYYLLTGKVPYDGANPTEKLMKHISDPPPSLSARLPAAPPQLDAVIRWMMAKSPADRPRTPSEAAAALAPFCPPPPAGSQPHPAVVVPPAAIDPTGSSQLFVLPASEAPARVRERGRTAAGSGRWVGLVAAVAVGTLGYVGYRLAFLPDPPPPAEYTNPVGMKFVLIPAGKFPMGSPDREQGRAYDEGPVGEVTLDRPFYMAATETTSGQYQQLMLTRSPAWTATRVKGGADWPVEQVTWDEAADFCRKLNDRDRGKRRGWSYRLPTEAEWEYACRAGTTTPYWCGEQLTAESGELFDPAAKDDEGPKPKMPNKVGQSRPNPFGLFDMAGNVAEWCGDFHTRTGYPPGPRANPTGPAAGEPRVIRGGSFKTPMAAARSAARRGDGPTSTEPDVGFRVVLAPVP